MLIPTTVPNLMKFGSFVLQGRWGIGKGELLLLLFFFFLAVTSSPHPPLMMSIVLKQANSYNCIFTSLCDRMTTGYWSCAIKRGKKYRWHRVFFFPSNRFVPDVWILIISLGLNSRHNIDFCLMKERESETPSRRWYLQEMFCLFFQICQSRTRNPKSKWASESSFVLDPIFISPLIDRLENSFVKTCGRILKVEPVN